MCHRARGGAVGIAVATLDNAPRRHNIDAQHVCGFGAAHPLGECERRADCGVVLERAQRGIARQHERRSSFALGTFALRTRATRKQSCHGARSGTGAERERNVGRVDMRLHARRIRERRQ
jgi:hypothetical protein